MCHWGDTAHLHLSLRHLLHFNDSHVINLPKWVCSLLLSLITVQLMCLLKTHHPTAWHPQYTSSAACSNGIYMYEMMYNLVFNSCVQKHNKIESRNILNHNVLIKYLLLEIIPLDRFLCVQVTQYIFFINRGFWFPISTKSSTQMDFHMGALWFVFGANHNSAKIRLIWSYHTSTSNFLYYNFRSHQPLLGQTSMHLERSYKN